MADLRSRIIEALPDPDVTGGSKAAVADAVLAVLAPELAVVEAAKSNEVFRRFCPVTWKEEQNHSPDSHWIVYRYDANERCGRCDGCRLADALSRLGSEPEREEGDHA